MAGPDEEPTSTVSPVEAQAALRFAASVALTLLVAGPGLISAAQGDRDFVQSGWFFLLAFGVSWVGTGILWSIWLGYRRSIDAAARASERQSLAVEIGRRKAELARELEAATRPPLDDNTV
jgi:hypothetical protein